MALEALSVASGAEQQYSGTALGRPKRNLEAPGEGRGHRILRWRSEVALNAGLLVALSYIYIYIYTRVNLSLYSDRVK